MTAAHRPPPAAVAALAAELAALGAVVSTEPAARRAASADFSHLSPILPGRLPDHPADLVCYPSTVDELVAAVRLAVRHRVPVTPRGQGTGNYGQAVPLAGGLVIDLSRLDRVLAISAGLARVEAGATFVAIEAAARRTGQELAMMPTTVGSTIGGFLAGGAGGIGSIQHGWLWDGFVTSLDVIPAASTPAVETVTGAACAPFLHAYGVTGVIAGATVRLAPARDWVALLAAADDHATAVRAGQALMRLDPLPRLVSIDDPAVVALFPADPALAAGRYSVRAIVAASSLPAAREAVDGADVLAVRPDGAGYLSTLAFNHVTLRARKARPELCHLQVGGAPLVDDPAAVRAVLPAGTLHLDGFRERPPSPEHPAGEHGFAGLLLSEFRGADRLYAGIDRLRAMGVFVLDPHTWLLGGPALESIRSAARRYDPHGLLNPGKLPPAD